MLAVKDLTGREVRTWYGISISGAEVEVSELFDDNVSFVLKLPNELVAFDLPKGKLVATLERAAIELRARRPDLAGMADQLDAEAAAARRDQERLGTR